MLVVSWRLLKRLMPRRKSMARRAGASTLMARGRAGVDEGTLKISANCRNAQATLALKVASKHWQVVCACPSAFNLSLIEVNYSP
jgi:hypothetical protein